MSAPTDGRWTIMRQIVIGTADLAATSQQIRTAFRLAPGFPDELLEAIGLHDETIPVGPQAHLEVVGPLDAQASINAWLARVGGTAGYCLSIQVPDLDRHLAAIEADGVRLAMQTEAYGRRIVQLHPGDMGLLVELDEIPDPTQWFWDKIDKEESPQALIDDVLGVTLSTPDPQERARRWAAVLCTPLEEIGGNPAVRLGSEALGHRSVTFVRDDKPRMSAIDVRAVADAELPDEIDLGQVTLRVCR